MTVDDRTGPAVPGADHWLAGLTADAAVAVYCGMRLAGRELAVADVRVCIERVRSAVANVLPRSATAAPFDSWAYQVACAAMDAWEAAHGDGAGENGCAAATSTPTYLARGVLARLQREVLVLRVGLGCSTTRTAELMGGGVAQVSRLQHDAIVALRACITPRTPCAGVPGPSTQPPARDADAAVTAAALGLAVDDPVGRALVDWVRAATATSALLRRHDRPDPGRTNGRRPAHRPSQVRSPVVVALPRTLAGALGSAAAAGAVAALGVLVSVVAVPRLTGGHAHLRPVTVVEAAPLPGIGSSPGDVAGRRGLAAPAAGLGTGPAAGPAAGPTNVFRSSEGSAASLPAFPGAPSAPAGRSSSSQVTGAPTNVRSDPSSGATSPVPLPTVSGTLPVGSSATSTSGPTTTASASPSTGSGTAASGPTPTGTGTGTGTTTSSGSTSSPP